MAVCECIPSNFSYTIMTFYSFQEASSKEAAIGYVSDRVVYQDMYYILGDYLVSARVDENITTVVFYRMISHDYVAIQMIKISQSKDRIELLLLSEINSDASSSLTVDSSVQ